MNNAKNSLESRNSAASSMGDIADWLAIVSKQDSATNSAFRKTLDNLLDG
ncbi:hypothetical protein [Croceicoccus bisphenolivorans]|nr:hypothetical protein [Croceicoccus bisphenolivorans]